MVLLLSLPVITRRRGEPGFFDEVVPDQERGVSRFFRSASGVQERLPRPSGFTEHPKNEMVARVARSPQRRFQSPWEGIRRARLNLLEAFSQAMIAVSSTSASSS